MKMNETFRVVAGGIVSGKTHDVLTPERPDKTVLIASINCGFRGGFKFDPLAEGTDAPPVASVPVPPVESVTVPPVELAPTPPLQNISKASTPTSTRSHLKRNAKKPCAEPVQKISKPPTPTSTRIYLEKNSAEKPCAEPEQPLQSEAPTPTKRSPRKRKSYVDAKVGPDCEMDAVFPQHTLSSEDLPPIAHFDELANNYAYYLL